VRASRPLREGTVATLVACAALPGLLPSAQGPASAPDPLALFAWLVLVAPATGAAAGRSGLGVWPTAWIGPAAWCLLVAYASASAERGLPSPSFGMCVVVGLHFLGFAAGRLAVGSPARVAGAVLLLTLGLAGISVAAGLGGPEAAWGRSSVALGRALLEASPLVVAFESAGVDWTHGQALVYERAAVEWIPRDPYRGPLAGPVLLLVGSGSAWLASRWRLMNHPG
jgi:hypothetical protein